MSNSGNAVPCAILVGQCNMADNKQSSCGRSFKACKFPRTGKSWKKVAGSGKF